MIDDDCTSFKFEPQPTILNGQALIISMSERKYKIVQAGTGSEAEEIVAEGRIILTED